MPTAFNNEWNEDFNSNPPSRQALYDLRDKFEQHGSVMDAPRSGRPRTAQTEENELRICLAVTQNPL